jgi:hypothetical protein
MTIYYFLTLLGIGIIMWKLDSIRKQNNEDLDLILSRMEFVSDDLCRLITQLKIKNRDSQN